MQIEVRDGYTPDITLLTEFNFWDDIYYYEDENENMKEACGKWLGRAQNYYDYMCSWILTEKNRSNYFTQYDLSCN